MKTRSQIRMTRIDVAALLAFAAVWAYYIFTVRYGFCTTDESLFVTIAQRLLQGDRLLFDESNAGQFSSIFLFLPYKLFVSVTGGTAGVILFMRYLFLAANAVFYWVMYRCLRVYGWSALIASLLFSLYVPLLFFACNHYTMPIRLLMIVCLLLFSEKQTPASLLLAGVLLACSVLYQPSFALVYLGFTVLVWVRFFRQKRGKRFLDDFAFCLHMRAWIYITVSVCVCAAAYLFWLLGRGKLQDALTALPFVLNNPDLDFSQQGDMSTAFFRKIGEAIDIYGVVCIIPTLVTAVLAIAFARGAFRRSRDTARKILFCLACAVWVLSCIQAFRVFRLKQPDVFFTMYPAPTLWLGFVCFLLCKHKNKRFLLFWVVGLVSSLCIDFSSHTALSLGCPIAYIADLIFFVDLVRELRAELQSKAGVKVYRFRDLKREKQINFAVRWCTRLACCSLAAWSVFIMVFENTAFPEHFLSNTPLFSLPYVCTEGPWRSLHVSQVIGEDYDRHLADIDTIKETQPKNLFVCGLAPELYLHAGLPCSASSPWTQRKASFLEQQIRYWELHPERLPECIYLPVDLTYNNHGSAEGQLDWIRKAFDPLCEYTAEQGQGGYILYVSQWHPDAGTSEK